MALTITQVPDSIFQFGNFTGVVVKCVPASADYPTHGYPLGPTNVGLRTLALAWPNVSPVSSTPVTSAPFVAWDAFNQKLQAFEAAAVTPTGTISVPTVTVVGGQSAGAALQILPDSASGVLGSQTGSTVTIPGATFGIGAQTFTGAAQAAGLLAECAASTDLSAYEFLVFCLGTP